jgi:hypothetical protein
MRPIYVPGLDVDANPAFVFQCGGRNLWAVTLDGSGASLPRDACHDGWRLARKFPLGVREPVPIIAVNAETVLQGILAEGYCLWRPRAGCTAHQPAR